MSATPNSSIPVCQAQLFADTKSREDLHHPAQTIRDGVAHAKRVISKR